MFNAAILTLLLAQDSEPLPDTETIGDVNVIYKRTPAAVLETSDRLGFDFVAVSPDGHFVAGASIDRIVVWNAQSRKELAKIAQGRHGGISALAFAPKGDLLASVDTAGEITLIDTRTWKVKQTIKYADGGFFGMAFSPDGAVIATVGTADNRDLVLWDVAQGIRQQRAHLTDEKTAIGAIAFSPSGKYIAVGWGRKLVLWDFATFKEVLRFAGHGGVSGLAFSPDSSKLISVAPSESKPATRLDKKIIKVCGT